MLMAESIAARIRDDALMRGVPVRVERDEPDDPEQVIISETQGYQGVMSQAPLWNPQYSVYVRAPDRGRAFVLCLRAYALLFNFIPEGDGVYAHGAPSIGMTPGYIGDDDRERPVYGFTFTHTVSPADF
jgi:hypothetical protein